MKPEIVFVILKPDALERGLAGRIISRIEDTYLRLDGMSSRRKTREWCDRHYGHLRGETFYDKLVEFMTARSILGFGVSGPNAIQRMRALAGPTKPWEAPPGTIRGDFGGYPAMYNLIHVSDSDDAARNEVRWFYDITTDAQPELSNASERVQ